MDKREIKVKVMKAPDLKDRGLYCRFLSSGDFEGSSDHCEAFLVNLAIHFRRFSEAAGKIGVRLLTSIQKSDARFLRAFDRCTG